MREWGRYIQENGSLSLPEAICTAAASANSADHQRVTAVARLLALADKYYKSGAQGYYCCLRALALQSRWRLRSIAKSGFSWRRLDIAGICRQVTSKATKIRCSFQAIFSFSSRAGTSKWKNMMLPCMLPLRDSRN